MAGEASRAVTKSKAVAEVEPISVDRSCSFVPATEIERNNCKECKRNHAVSFGRYAFEGYAEFMSCNDDVCMCAACGCHRSFHRKHQHNINPTPPPSPSQYPMPPDRYSAVLCRSWSYQACVPRLAEQQ